jgi:hypothetical protein
MPIKPENRDRYPANWKDLSAAVKDAQGWRCGFCNLKHGERICRGTGENAETFQDADGYVHDANTGARLGRVRMGDYEGSKWVTVVLTTAHLDHRPENCDSANLKALCQRCHLRYDAEHHRRNAQATRRSRLAMGDLFEERVSGEKQG